MKRLQTTKQLRGKYNPDSILIAIDKSFKDNLDKLKSSLSDSDSPLKKYNSDLQFSLLESQISQNDDLIEEISLTLKDTVYFMLLSKKDRIHVSQTMRSYHSNLVKNQLKRVELLLEDSEIGSPKYGHDPTPKHKRMNQVFHILNRVKRDLELELSYWNHLTRTSYLTGFQTSMGEFFITLKRLGMNQKDQITLVQRLFDTFDVDWDAGERGNIKLSLQQPALSNYEIIQRDLRQISSTFFSKSLSEVLVLDLIDHARIMKKRLRRF